MIDTVHAEATMQRRSGELQLRTPITRRGRENCNCELPSHGAAESRRVVALPPPKARARKIYACWNCACETLFQSSLQCLRDSAAPCERSSQLQFSSPLLLRCLRVNRVRCSVPIRTSRRAPRTSSPCPAAVALHAPSRRSSPAAVTAASDRASRRSAGAVRPRRRAAHPVPRCPR